MSSRGPCLFVTYSGQRGGAGQFLAEIAAGMTAPAVVACPSGPLVADCRERGIPVLELPQRPLALRGDLRTAAGAARALAGHAREIRRLVRDLDPSLLFTWGMRSGLAAALALRGRSDTPWAARHHDFLPRGPAASAVRRALARADAVVVNSRAVAEDLGLAEPVDVVLPGVDLARFAPGPARAAQEDPTVLWLGAIVPWKRPELALAVAERSDGVAFRIAGAPLDVSGERLLARLRERAAAGVELCGTVDPAAELARADLLLHTADREPFGIAVAEALASGVPVVAPAAGGPADVVDESCGRLFPPGDADAAARAVREVLAARDELSRGARSRAEERLDLERACEEFRTLVARHADSTQAQPNPEHGSQLALVVVTHDSARELDRLLRSAARHIADAELIVADSGSNDDSAEVARRYGAKVVELENVGYGRAANAGIAEATRPVTVVMNPDLELVDGSLAALADELTRPGAPERLLVPGVTLPDGTRQDVAQREPATAPMLAFALLPPAVLPRRARAALEPWRSERPARAGWPVGACLAGRTETLRRLGPFDEGIFMYAEDLDLGLRAADAGVETWFWPRARVLHERGHSTRRAFGGEAFELLARRRREVIAKRRGRVRLLADDALQALTFADRIALKTLARRDTERERRQLAALRSARRESEGR